MTHYDLCICIHGWLFILIYVVFFLIIVLLLSFWSRRIKLNILRNYLLARHCELGYFYSLKNLSRCWDSTVAESGKCLDLRIMALDKCVWLDWSMMLCRRRHSTQGSPHSVLHNSGERRRRCPGGCHEGDEGEGGDGIWCYAWSVCRHDEVRHYWPHQGTYTLVTAFKSNLSFGICEVVWCMWSK